MELPEIPFDQNDNVLETEMIFEYDISYMNGLKLKSPEAPFDQNDTGLEMETIEILKKTYDDFEKRHGK